MRILPVRSNTNVITIEKNIPVPSMKVYGCVEKYSFLKSMDIGDSFSINGNTPDFTPAAVRSFIYGQNANKKTNRYTIRTTAGRSGNPSSIRVWRVK
tara:strand:+ start:235 stop:525 length:291 start_codon:yes stop_codon:yes gene_type:complete